MSAIDRRTFLRASGATIAAAVASQAGPAPAQDRDPGGPRWRKAYMLNGLRAGAVEDQFRMLKEAGFEGVELGAPNDLDTDEVLRARDKTGLIIHGVSGTRHWRDTLSHPDPEVVRRGQDAIRQAILQCKAYGGTTVLVVPAVVTPEVSHRDAYSRSQAALRPLLTDAAEAGIILAIEEVWNRFLLSAPEMARYVDEFHSPWVKAYFDVGNVVEYGYPQEWIRELGPRIAKIHIKEYSKKGRFDHPLGEGEIDWPAVRQALVDVNYRGWITAEVSRGDLDHMKDVVRRMDTILPQG